MRNPFIFALLFLLFSAAASAEDFYWQVSGYPTKHANPEQACRSIDGSPWGDGKMVYKSTQSTPEPNKFDCYVDLYNGNGSLAISNYPGTFASRYGTACREGTIYNSATGNCEGPPEPENKCKDRAGQQRKFQKRGTIGDGWFSVTDNGFGVHPQDNCVEGCQAWTEGVKCTYNNLVGNVYLCRGTANLTGAECGTSGADAEETDDNTMPEPQRIVDKKPCVYKTNSDGTQTCESESSDSKDGQHCGEVNGVRKCIDEAPTKNGIDIRTDIKTEPTPDGGTKTTKTDVTTKTECKNGKCSTSTTTRTTTTTKDANGKTSSVSGTCTGKDCKEKNEDPEGNGNGTGNCTGKDCGDDPFDEGMGEGGFYEPGTDTFESVLGEFQVGVSQLAVIDGVGNFLAFNPSGSCPTASTTVWIFTIQADQWCGNSIPWALIRAVIMGAAAFLAFRFAFL